jgi:hypothetical protein
VPDGTGVFPHPLPVEPGGRRVAEEGPFAWPHAHAAGGGTVDLSVVPERDAPSEMLYLTELPEGWYEIGPDPASGDDRPAFRLSWDVSVLPHLWLWQELGADKGWPWYGRAYVVGLEPFSSHPTDGIAAAVDNGTALRLAPRQELALSWSAEILPEGLSAAQR